MMMAAADVVVAADNLVAWWYTQCTNRNRMDFVQSWLRSPFDVVVPPRIQSDSWYHVSFRMLNIVDTIVDACSSRPY